MDDLADADRRILVAELRSAPGVQRVEYVSRREALRRYRAWAGETAELIDELDSNPLPASLEVVLQPGAQAADTAAGIASGVEGRPGVEDVRFNQAWLHRVESALGLARVGGTALAILIFGAVVFVVASVLRLAVYRRRDEIEIMRLVGATPGFIRGPFLVAGAAQGLIASLVALLLVESIRSAALAYTGSGSLALLELVAAQPLARNFAAILLVVGLFVSLAGSYFSVGEEGASS
jgi:cell division transport system permease protein